MLVQYLDEHGAPIVPPPPRWGPGSRAVRFHGLRRSIVQWVLDVEAVARRCGADDAQPLHPPTGLGTMKTSMQRSVEVCLAVVRLSPAC